MNNMNWFQLIAPLLAVWSGAIAPKVLHSPEAKKANDLAVGLAAVVIAGLANQNPDGTPAAQAYSGPPAVVPVTATAVK